MNTEITKAIERKKKSHPIRNWWRKNSYKIFRVLFFYIWIPILLKEKITNYLNSQEIWSEERAKTILDYYVPNYAEWDEKDQSFYFFDNGCGWSWYFAKKIVKREDRRFWELYYYKIRSYLINTFELEGFTKEIGNCSEGWTEITFTI